jgi:hypothetical protein
MEDGSAVRTPFHMLYESRYSTSVASRRDEVAENALRAHTHTHTYIYIYIYTHTHTSTGAADRIAGRRHSGGLIKGDAGPVVHPSGTGSKAVLFQGGAIRGQEGAMCRWQKTKERGAHLRPVETDLQDFTMEVSSATSAG